MLRPTVIVVIGLGLPACHPHNPQRGTDLKSVIACKNAQTASDDYTRISACEPLGPEEEFRGTWFVGYELSAFHSGYLAVPAKLGNLQDTRIVVPSPLARQKLPPTNPATISAFRISFAGRESLLKSIFPGQQPILMDHLESIQAVPFDVTDFNRSAAGRVDQHSAASRSGRA